MLDKKDEAEAFVPRDLFPEGSTNRNEIVSALTECATEEEFVARMMKWLRDEKN